MIKPLENLAGAVPERGSAGIEPAKDWEFAFVSGNGRMGAMVFGHPAKETIFANHCRLFLPINTREILPNLAKHVPELRSIINEKGYDAAMEFFLGKAKEQGYPGLQWTDPFHPAFELRIRQNFDGTPTDYVRTEDFRAGEVAVQWTADAGAFRRRLVVSRPDNVIVLSVTGPKAGTVGASFDIPFDDWGEITRTAERAAGWMTFHNVYEGGLGGFADGRIPVLQCLDQHGDRASCSGSDRPQSSSGDRAKSLVLALQYLDQCGHSIFRGGSDLLERPDRTEANRPVTILQRLDQCRHGILAKRLEVTDDRFDAATAALQADLHEGVVEIAAQIAVRLVRLAQFVKERPDLEPGRAANIQLPEGDEHDDGQHGRDRRKGMRLPETRYLHCVTPEAARVLATQHPPQGFRQPVAIPLRSTCPIAPQRSLIPCILPHARSDGENFTRRI